MLFSGAATGPSQLMFDEQVTKEGDKWTYSPVKFWPNNPSTKISFFGYYPYSAGTWTAPSPGTASTETMVTNLPTKNDPRATRFKVYVGSNVAKQKDVMFCKNLDVTNTGGNIPMNFEHALTRLSFEVTPWEKSGHDIYTTVQINSIKVGVKHTSGTYDIYNNSWPSFDEANNAANGWPIGYTLSPGARGRIQSRPSGKITQALHDVDKGMIILPSATPDDMYAVYINYTVTTIDRNVSGNSVVTDNYVVRVIKPNFQAGKHYKINIHLGLDGENVTETAGLCVSEATSPAIYNQAIFGEPDPIGVTPTLQGKCGYVGFEMTTEAWNNLPEPPSGATP